MLIWVRVFRAFRPHIPRVSGDSRTTRGRQLVPDPMIEHDASRAYSAFVQPRLQAEVSVEARSTVWRAPDDTWTVTTAKELVMLDTRLAPVARFPLPGDWPGTHAVAANAGSAALSLPDRVTLVDASGRLRWEITHTPWTAGASGSTWMAPDGLVWAVVPGPDGADSPDHWWVLDAATGSVLHDVALDGCSAGSDPIGHGDDVLLGVSAGGEDDGFRIYAGCRDGAGATVRAMPGTDRVLADLHRSGDRYLTTDRHHEDVAVHSLTDGAVLITRPAEEIFGPDDFIDFHAAFVTEDRVVVRSVLEQQHLVLDAGRLEVIGPVEYPEGAARDAVLPAGEGSWVTTDWLDGRVQLWAL
jgi:hypothetical protein